MRGKEKGACEDAYFLHSLAVGLSDGVGGWSNYGITASSFSQSLMKNSKRAIVKLLKQNNEKAVDTSIRDSILFDIEDCRNLSHEIGDELRSSDLENLSSYWSTIDPVRVLSQAFNEVQYCGSATATICMLKENNLVCANLGDSGFKVIRFNNFGVPYIYFESKDLQHDFNTPFQLCKMPTPKFVEEKLHQAGFPRYQAEDMIKKFKTLTFCQDPPEASSVYDLRVEEGDLLIVGTDGLFDNLFSSELLSLVKELHNHGGNKVDPMLIAHVLAEKAYEKSVNQKEDSPFSLKVKSMSTQHYTVNNIL